MAKVVVSLITGRRRGDYSPTQSLCVVKVREHEGPRVSSHPLLSVEVGRDRDGSVVLTLRGRGVSLSGKGGEPGESVGSFRSITAEEISRRVLGSRGWRQVAVPQIFGTINLGGTGQVKGRISSDEFRLICCFLPPVPEESHLDDSTFSS